ncbi:MAG: hypothetical protein CVU63_21040 [Deltaproteobacteria bacterium HGW-Deltaproteobacteria-20]|nr:MAG: hypothetical protein CVU63_21040 [Deltaproteobacteria bacterium HGW-Deltaproteobacteria-20]
MTECKRTSFTRAPSGGSANVPSAYVRGGRQVKCPLVSDTASSERSVVRPTSKQASNGNGMDSPTPAE